MLLGARPVVPNDIVVGADYSLLILSGPNAGGKSVALKTCGLCVLMVRCGLLIPASPDSYVPLFDGVSALPGDLEDVEQQLSTFTGHLHALNRTLAAADERRLVLIDEIAVGTEPDQGSALGAGYLLELAETGALCIVATHYERLKALAMSDSRFENASMGMDWDSLTPTYKLAIGSPGSSRTLEIAARCDVPETVLQRASDILAGKEGGVLESAIRSLSEQERELAGLAEQHREALLEAEELKRKRANSLIQLTRHSNRLIARKVRAALDEVENALELVSSMEAQLQKKKPDREGLSRNRRTLKEIRERLKAKADRLEDEETEREYAEARRADFVVGGEVLVKKFKKKAVILALSLSDGAASLKMGPMRLRMPLSGLVPLEASGRGQERAAAGSRVQAAHPPTAPTRLDIRGAYAEEGIDRLQMALDQAMLSSGGMLLVVHGHGTGKLKTAVRRYLKETSYPVRFRPGKREEGGDGVTVVEFV